MKQDEQIKLMFVEKIKEVFDIPRSNYVTHKMPRYNCIQLWRRGWSNSKEVSTHKGIHYEILFLKNFDNLCEKNTEVRICFHNESTKLRLPKGRILSSRDLFSGKFDFDTDEHVEKSINDIVTKLKEIVDATSDDIDKKITQYQEQL